MDEKYTQDKKFPPIKFLQKQISRAIEKYSAKIQPEGSLNFDTLAKAVIDNPYLVNIDMDNMISKCVKTHQFMPAC